MIPPYPKDLYTRYLLPVMPHAIASRATATIRIKMAMTVTLTADICAEGVRGSSSDRSRSLVVRRLYRIANGQRQAENVGRKFAGSDRTPQSAFYPARATMSAPGEPCLNHRDHAGTSSRPLRSACLAPPRFLIHRHQHQHRIQQSRRLVLHPPLARGLPLAHPFRQILLPKRKSWCNLNCVQTNGL